MTTNILNYAEYDVLSIKEKAEGYFISAETGTCSPCPACSEATGIVRFGTALQIYIDAPMHGKKVAISISRRRYRCNSCGRTFMQPLPEIDDRRRCTKRLLKYVQDRVFEYTFLSIANDTGLDEKTIRNIFMDYTEVLDKTIRFETPSHMGIGEVYILKKPRCVIVNLKESTIVDILPMRSRAIVENFLSNLPDANKIRYVCMDMWTPYREAARITLPEAAIVVDHFHLTRLACDVVESCRKEITKALPPKEGRSLMHQRHLFLEPYCSLTDEEKVTVNKWLLRSPALASVHAAKESFANVYSKGKSSRDASVALSQWKNDLDAVAKPYYQPLLAGLENWEQEFLAFFDHPTELTNACTEAINGIAKLAAKNGRGYSFDVLRFRVLYKNKHKKKISLRSRMKSSSLSTGNMQMDSAQEINYGVDIAELIKNASSGDYI